MKHPIPLYQCCIRQNVGLDIRHHLYNNFDGGGNGRKGNVPKYTLESRFLATIFLPSLYENFEKNTLTENERTADVKTYQGKTELSVIDTPLEISCDISNGGVVVVTPRCSMKHFLIGVHMKRSRCNTFYETKLVLFIRLS